ASGPDGSLKETAKGSLQRSFRQLNEAKRLGEDVKGKLKGSVLKMRQM
ncbi:hypothetical protein scyTo_0024984, partial [Scyliorhinus torazame]|nr:hypothetical protein [Scyliorhinus torazame]